MRAVVQRVSRAQVRVEGNVVGAIDRGLLVYLGIGKEDGPLQSRQLAEKIAHLRLFEDATGKLHYSVLDISGAILVVSQFTLYGTVWRGRRPDFLKAASAEVALPYYLDFIKELEALGAKVATGQFQAQMEVEACVDGPITLWVEKD